MEARRIFWNRKSVTLFIVFFLVNAGLFFFTFLQDYVPLEADEVIQIDYAEKYDGISRQIEEMKNIPLFQGDDNILEDEKMLRDYGKVRDVRGETARSEGVSLWFADSIQNYLALFFCVWLVFLTFDVEKRGLFPLVYATERGRGVLAAKRLVYYFLASLVSCVVFHLSLLVSACIKVHDISALFQPVQFVNGLEGCILPVDAIEFFCIVTVVSACGVFVVTLFCWMFLLMIHNSKIALSLAGSLFVAEYVLKQWLPTQSRFGMLKDINVLTLLDVNGLYTEYHLYTAGGICMERKEWIYVALSVLAVLFSVICVILSSRRRPYYQKHLVERTVHRFFCYIRRMLCRLPGRCFEWYKMLVSQKGLYVLVFFMALLVKGVWQPASEGEKLILGSTGEYMKDFYEEWTGPVTEEVRDEISGREAQMEKLIGEGNPAAGYYSNGLRKVKERVRYIEKHKGEELWLVSPDGYRYLLGEKGERSSAGSMLLALFCMLMLISGLFSYEKKSSMEFLLRSTPYGRDKLQKRKYRITAVLTVLLWAVLGSMEVYNIRKTYSLDGLDAPVHSLPFMADVPFDITIWQYCLIVYVVRLAGMFLVSVVYCEISVWLKNQEISILSGSLLLIPSVLYLMGVEAFKFFSVTKVIHVSHFLRQGISGIGKLAVIFIAILFMVALSNVVAFHKKKEVGTC